MAKAQVQAEIRAEVRAETETRVRLDKASSIRKGLELDFGARWKAGKPGTEARAQFDTKRRKSEARQTNHLDFRKVASSLTSLNDAEAITILDREDARAVAAAEAAAAAASATAIALASSRSRILMASASFRLVRLEATFPRSR